MDTNDDAAHAQPGEEPNHISTLRRHLLDQVKALRAAGAEDVQREIDRSKAVAELAQAVVNTAKVEVDYLKATNQTSTPFLEVPPDRPYLPDAADKQGLPRNGITTVVRHRLQG
jgi:hypothetical protein